MTRALLFFPLLLTSACAEDPPTPRAPEIAARPEPILDPSPTFEPTRFDEIDTAREPLLGPQTVAELIEARGCSTEATGPLNAQIAAEIACGNPETFAAIDHIPNVRLGPAANPFLQRDAARGLAEIAAQRPWAPMVLNSTWRSPVQQLVLKRWEGSCGIGVAAPPGRSRHESGLAVDVPLPTLYTFHEDFTDRDWRWYCDATNRGFLAGCRDAPHFSLSKGQDLRSRGLRAFQTLWNRAHPDDLLPIHGRLDRATTARISRTPPWGFDKPPKCLESLKICDFQWRDVPRHHPFWSWIESPEGVGLWPVCDPARPWRFCPSDGVRRGELAGVLAGALGLEVGLAEGVFDDVSIDHPNAGAIEALAGLGIVSGTSEAPSLFHPEAQVDWSTIAVWIARARGLPLLPPEGAFRDVPETHWAAPHIEALAHHRPALACKPGKDRFCPGWRLSRSWMARFVVEGLGLETAAPCEGVSDGDRLPGSGLP